MSGENYPAYIITGFRHFVSALTQAGKKIEALRSARTKINRPLRVGVFDMVEFPPIMSVTF